jgi:antitoxin CptB
MANDPRLARLRWRCRRGMRELDQLFVHWLDTRAAIADEPTLRSFEELLDAEDSDLWSWAMGRGQPERADWQVLIEQLRATHRA